MDDMRDELRKRPAHRAAMDKAFKDGADNNTQTLIRIADRSELGWKVVEEYEADELASGRDDEKV